MYYRGKPWLLATCQVLVELLVLLEVLKSVAFVEVLRNLFS